MGKEVFISHATADGVMINILLEFLNNIGIENDDIFCTSISGSLAGGKSFVEQIRNNVNDSKAVIFLMTERFFLSSFCLAELGAAWAINQNILPIIVPPISTAEYNSTPLIGVQAPSMGSDDFANIFFNDLVRLDLIKSNSLNNAKAIFNNFNLKIKNEMKILRTDSKGFYIARLLDNQNRQVHQPLPTNQSAVDQMLFGRRNNTLIQNDALWRLNGLLDIETDSTITEHWISVRGVNLSSKKLLFEIGEPLEQVGNQKLFAIKIFYELP